jgi:hypothetical protein
MQRDSLAAERNSTLDLAILSKPVRAKARLIY